MCGVCTRKLLMTDVLRVCVGCVDSVLSVCVGYIACVLTVCEMARARDGCTMC